MIVLKFGGTSLRNGAYIQQATSLIEKQLKRLPVVVVSAHAGVTDHLIQLGEDARRKKASLQWIRHLHQKILQELSLPLTLIDPLLQELTQCLEKIAETEDASKQTQDWLLTFGERFSAQIVASHLSQLGIPAQAHLAPDLGLFTDDHFGQAQPLSISYPLIAQSLNQLDHLPVVTGFIGKTRQGEWTTLGRSGSDFSASIIANAISAEEIQFWKDVAGVMTADPQIIPEAETVPYLSFEEASEMASYGAKILHPSSVLPAIQKNIPIRILNTNEPDFHGTTIYARQHTPDGIKSIVGKKEVCVLRIFLRETPLKPELLQHIFGIFARSQIHLGLIATSEEMVTLTLNETPTQLSQICAEISELGTTVQIDAPKAIICLIGRGVQKAREIAAKVFQSLPYPETDVLMVSQGNQKLNIAFILSQNYYIPTIRKLHSVFFKKR